MKFISKIRGGKPTQYIGFGLVLIRLSGRFGSGFCFKQFWDVLIVFVLALWKLIFFSSLALLWFRSTISAQASDVEILSQKLFVVADCIFQIRTRVVAKSGQSGHCSKSWLTNLCASQPQKNIWARWERLMNISKKLKILICLQVCSDWNSKLVMVLMGILYFRALCYLLTVNGFF